MIVGEGLAPFDRLIRKIENFPVAGVTFFDATPLFADGRLFRESIHRLAEPFKKSHVDVVIGAESRGFIIAPSVALELGAGFAPARKPGKLPFRTRFYKYALDDKRGVVRGEVSPRGAVSFATYSKPYEFEVHEDAVQTGQNVVIVDDLLAKGGTAAACIRLVEEAGAKVVGCSFLIELVELGGALRLAPCRVSSLLRY